MRAVIATGIDRGTSQWAAVVNHDTNRWTQVDLFPPCRCYDPWTSFVMGFGQGTGNLAKGIMWLYAAVLALLFLYLGRTGTSFLTGLFLGLGVGFVHTLVGQWQSARATKQYGRALKEACDRVFAGAA